LNPKKAIEFPDINHCDKIFAAWYAEGFKNQEQDLIFMFE